MFCIDSLGLFVDIAVHGCQQRPGVRGSSRPDLVKYKELQAAHGTAVMNVSQCWDCLILQECSWLFGVWSISPIRKLRGQSSRRSQVVANKTHAKDGDRALLDPRVLLSSYLLGTSLTEVSNTSFPLRGSSDVSMRPCLEFTCATGSPRIQLVS